MLNIQHFPLCIYIYPNAFFAFIGMQSSPGLWTRFNSSPQASDHSVGSRDSDWSPLASDSSAILPILRSERELMVQSARNENMLDLLWWGGLVCASGCSWSHRCVCVCVSVPTSSLVDQLFPRKLTWLGKQKLHSHWPTSPCCNKSDWATHFFFCEECALWVQLKKTKTTEIFCDHSKRVFVWYYTISRSMFAQSGHEWAFAIGENLKNCHVVSSLDTSYLVSDFMSPF